MHTFAAAEAWDGATNCGSEPVAVTRMGILSGGLDRGQGNGRGRGGRRAPLVQGKGLCYGLGHDRGEAALGLVVKCITQIYQNLL